MPSYLDLAVLGIVLVSALLSMMCGFSREVLAIASWAAAAAAAYYFYPLVVPYLTPYIHKEVIAQAAAAAIVFFRNVDHRFAVYGSSLGRDPRQQDRRPGSDARVRVRRCERVPSRASPSPSSTGWFRRSSNRNGSKTPGHGRSSPRRPIGSSPCCPRTRRRPSTAGSSRARARPRTSWRRRRRTIWPRQTPRRPAINRPRPRLPRRRGRILP